MFFVDCSMRKCMECLSLIALVGNTGVVVPLKCLAGEGNLVRHPLGISATTLWAELLLLLVSVGKDDKDDSDDSKKRLKAVSHAGKNLIPNHADKEANISSHADKESTPNRRTYADVLRGCKGPKANVAYVNGTVGKDNEHLFPHQSPRQPPTLPT
ncbi:hypothetical protein IV203_002321 [Nitzschia inconspicua]|uniref:Uncharacterized protein n=1 Tax=Nitzschia inconspicua TaxID=303405 RepID=A0A9K3LA50_9STRA|nr:hypothetical protein IV203_002321 [Nitzschia inconspicua]